MKEEKKEWTRILTYETEPKSLNDYIVYTDGCGCCSADKQKPTKEDLDILEKNINQQLELVNYLRDKYGLG